MELQQNKRYTYEDYLNWPEGERAELIDGVIYAQAAPASAHQLVVEELHVQLHNQLRGKTCSAHIAPFEVRPIKGSKDAVVQPDVFIVCDKSKIVKWGCDGAPDMIAEVLSPSTQRVDKITKRNLYARCGVKEYWLIDPDAKLAEVNYLDGDSYRVIGAYAPGDTAPVLSVPGCIIDIGELFPE